MRWERQAKLHIEIKRLLIYFTFVTKSPGKGEGYARFQGVMTPPRMNSYSSKTVHRRGGGCKHIPFLKAFSLPFQESLISNVDRKISASQLQEICHYGVVFTQRVSPPTSFGGIISKFVSCIYQYRQNLRSCPLSKV